jgi:hypothetical protein
MLSIFQYRDYYIHYDVSLVYPGALCEYRKNTFTNFHLKYLRSSTTNSLNTSASVVVHYFITTIMNNKITCKARTND